MRDINIQASFPRDIFVKLVNLLDHERTNLEYFLKSPSTTGEEIKRYKRELYDVKSMLACLLEEDADEDADEYDEPV